MNSNNNEYQWQNWDIRTAYKPMQWRSMVCTPMCAFCKKTVYPAEELNAAGQKFHKLCLKCSKVQLLIDVHILTQFYVFLATCSTLLNPGNLNEHEKKIYCVPCHRRQFGPRGGKNLL